MWRGVAEPRLIERVERDDKFLFKSNNGGFVDF